MSTEETQPSTPPSLLTVLGVATGTDVGLRREENQDSFGVITKDNFHLYVVADGMGGVKGGAVASKLAIDVLNSELDLANTFDIELLSAAVRNANRAIYEKGLADPGLLGMGTTFVGLGFTKDSLIVAHVGDSRAYLIRSGKAYQLSDDHTLVRELVRSGAITPEQAEHHPVSHMLTRSLGPVEEVEVEAHRFEHGPASGDKFLLCSDGLYNLVTADEIAEISTRLPKEEAVQRLIGLANERGGTDNITVVIVEIAADYAVTAESVTTPPSAPVLENSHFEVDAGASSDSGEIGEAGQEPKVIRIDSLATLRRPDGVEGDLGHGADDGHLTSPTNADQRPVPSARSSQVLTLGLVVVLSVIVGMLWRGPSGDGGQQIANPVPNPLSAAQGGVESHHDVKIQERPQLDREPLKGDGGGASRDALQRRLRAVSVGMADLQERLSLLEGTISNKTVEALQKRSSDVGEIERKQELVRDEIDRETRRLSVWIGRRKRMDSTNAVDMATEVAAVSASVRGARQAFEDSSWAYLKEVEVWRYDPSNEELSNKVSALAKERNQRMEELAQAVRSAIESEVDVVNQRLAELTQQRDEQSILIQKARDDHEFVRELLAADDAGKARLRANIERQLQVAEDEVAELKRILAEQ